MEQLARQTLKYLLEMYPLEVSLSPFSKVKKPTLEWALLPADTYGWVSWAHHGLVITLNSGMDWTPDLLVNTVAHEYYHVLHGPAIYKWYQRRLQYPYWWNPCEVKARAFAADITVTYLAEALPL